VLTSLDRADLDAALIVPGSMEDLVLARADRAFAAGADGVIASPHEAAAIRALPSAGAKLIVTPGIRPAGQRPRRPEAHRHPRRGARRRRRPPRRRPPVWAAPDPRAAARAILREMAEV
jgi:orotidine-5'-phosphate decarboxylase